MLACKCLFAFGVVGLVELDELVELVEYFVDVAERVEAMRVCPDATRVCPKAPWVPV